MMLIPGMSGSWSKFLTSFVKMTSARNPKQSFVEITVAPESCGGKFWRRNHGGGIMGEESWRRKHKRGIMEGEILEEESWRRNHGRGIMEQESWDERAWERNHGREIVAEE